MAFTKAGFYFSSVGMGPLNTAVYKNISDSLATIKTSDYFPKGTNLALDDKIYIVGSDGREDVYVSGINPLIVTAINLAQAGHLVYTHVGTTTGTANQVFTIPGTLGTDHAIAMVQDASGNEVESALCTADTVKLWFEGTPQAGKDVFILVYR